MNNTQFFIGIDVSKPYFDASLIAVTNHLKAAMITERFTNDAKGINSFNAWLKSNKVTYDSNSLVVIENTGIYHRLLWAFCSRKNLSIHIGNAAHIKWSFGIARGKNDKIDSQRLCNYALKESDSLKASPPLNPVLLQLKDFMTARTKLLSQLNAVKTYISELKNVNDKTVQKTLEQAYRKAIEGMKESIKNIEAQIKDIILKHSDVNKNYKLLLSVPGIGHLTAVYLICCTNNFSGGISGKQLASYAGVVPFEHSSGISIKKRKKVHPMANKELKKMLFMCAMSAIQNHEEFRRYYKRKENEGKHGWAILNAIKNKILLRAVAVVNKQTNYVDNSKKAA